MSTEEYSRKVKRGLQMPEGQQGCAAFWLSTPLCTIPPVSCLSACAVPIHLNEPLGNSAPKRPPWTPARVGELLSICARLNVLLAKPRVREGSNTPNFASTEGMTALRQAMVDDLMTQLTAIVNIHPDCRDVPTMLTTHSMTRMFPTLSMALQLSLPPSASADSRSGKPPAVFSLPEYLKQMSNLSMLLGISRQIWDDLPLTTHKYIAHQVALLYQTVNLVRLPHDRFKKSIEANFDDIKKHTESMATPRLSEYHRRWMEDLISSIVKTIASCPPAMLARVNNWVALLEPFQQRQPDS